MKELQRRLTPGKKEIVKLRDANLVIKLTKEEILHLVEELQMSYNNPLCLEPDEHRIF